MVPKRLARLPVHHIGAGLAVHEARGAAARLLGLALLREVPRGRALLLPGCRSIHTFGMRVPLDVAFLAHDGTVIRVVRDVRPGRILRCPGAAHALETRAGDASLFLEGGRGAGARLRPRVSSTGSESSRCGERFP